MSFPPPQKPAPTTLKQIQVSPKKPDPQKARPRPYLLLHSHTSPSQFTQPIAAKAMQTRIRRYLNRKKFLSITLSDVQNEISDLNDLENGFTSFFIFIIFLVTYFWCLSIQMNPTLDYQMSQSLKTTMSTPKFGPNLSQSFSSVRNIDDALSYLESLYLSTYAGTENEHACSSCKYINDLTEQRFGVGVVDMCAEVQTNPTFNATKLPSVCSLLDLGKCIEFECFTIETEVNHMGNIVSNVTKEYKNRFEEVVEASETEYVPIKVDVDVNEFRTLTKERCKWETPWLYPHPNEFGGFTTRVAKSFGAFHLSPDFPKVRPNFNEEQIVDCDLTTLKIDDCISLGFNNCVGVTKKIHCNSEAGLNVNLNTNCSFFNRLEDKLCNDDVVNPNDITLPIECPEGSVLNCYLSECVPDTRGDGNCDLNLNCWNAQWDLGDCDGYPLKTDTLTCDCMGICFDEASCISYGVESCADLFYWFTTQDGCTRIDPEDPGVSTDCSFYNYDNGDCGSDPDSSSSSAGSVTEGDEYLTTVLLSYMGFLEGGGGKDGTCEETFDCLGECMDTTEFIAMVGDGVCHPRMNCRVFEFDGGDCIGTVPDEAELGCDGILDCHGQCITETVCASYSTSCEDLLYYYQNDGVCQKLETGGYSFDCPKYNFDNYACATGGGRRLDVEAAVRHAAGVIASGMGGGVGEFGGRRMGEDDDDDDNDDDEKEMEWGANLNEKLLQGGWIGNTRSVGGAILVQYQIKKRENCTSKYVNDAVFPMCDVDEVFTEPLDIFNRYPTTFDDSSESEEKHFHNDVIDTGRWNVGLKQMFCSIEKSRLFWSKDDQYKNLWISEMTINLPVYNGNVNGGMFALGSVKFTFLRTGEVEVEFDVRSYKLFGLMDFDDPDTGLRVRLEVIVTVFYCVLLFRAIKSVQATGLHLQNFLTILSSVVFLFIILLWSWIAWVSVSWELREADPLGGDDSYDSAIKMVSEQVDIKNIYDLYSEINILFCVLALVRCFMILSFHKRLSILTETLWEGLVDIYHWAMVLALFTTIFATVFYHLFGADTEQFSTWFKAFKSLLLLVVGLGDWELEEVNKGTIGWFLLLLYGAIVTILMINLSLGIVLDAYNIHSKERDESDTLPHSLSVYFYRKYNRIKHWAFNVRQMQQIPIPIKNAKEVLRDEYLSEDMICKILREVVVKKMVEGGIEKKRKETRVGKSKLNNNIKRKVKKS
ncbi:hypothetical protein TL16_g03433 [Triparma laevis f. inornata]|uniref:Polycystin cation channel PKD1/PKD2 domain-containing protein n=1 Tax=Triparma laevis f. inornata TaxID=1714386 RepID=A0A9W6ZYK2_9STRA|nr:hypothetical protein TL16_g03433 [Triparma laevis f. inornata]